jgi:hypothetical protein
MGEAKWICDTLIYPPGQFHDLYSTLAANALQSNSMDRRLSQSTFDHFAKMIPSKAHVSSLLFCGAPQMTRHFSGKESCIILTTPLWPQWDQDYREKSFWK